MPAPPSRAQQTSMAAARSKSTIGAASPKSGPRGTPGMQQGTNNFNVQPQAPQRSSGRVTDVFSQPVAQDPSLAGRVQGGNKVTDVFRDAPVRLDPGIVAAMNPPSTALTPAQQISYPSDEGQIYGPAGLGGYAGVFGDTPDRIAAAPLPQAKPQMSAPVPQAKPVPSVGQPVVAGFEDPGAGGIFGGANAVAAPAMQPRARQVRGGDRRGYWDELYQSVKG